MLGRRTCAGVRVTLDILVRPDCSPLDGYFLLEGFDFGVGMLLPVLPRDERERGLMFESIGPVWDGNEVWLVVAGGATFAAFPAWYATMFSGFYIALLLILVLLIVRVVSFEWRESRMASLEALGRADRRRSARLSLGHALASRLHGVPIGPTSSRDFGDLFSRTSGRDRVSSCSPPRAVFLHFAARGLR